jgi:hypothetical protein
VPGQGTFDAVRDGVVVRPVGALRDLLELNTGSRLLPVEE